MVKQKDGVVVRLGEIADVVLGAENYDEDVRFNGQTATFMGVWVLPTANSLEVIGAGARRRCRRSRRSCRPGMQAGIPYDSTEYIQDAIDEVLKTLGETLLIVIVVIFLFLGSFRAVLIPVVAIPISLVGAVFLMLAAGFTINLLTLLAIVLSVGLVVDDAIVMVENVERHLQRGQAAASRRRCDAARELVGPIIAMTITLAAVYTPIGIQGGLTGALFREFAFTLAGAVIVSGVVALTLSPMMGSRLLRPGDAERGFAGLVNRRFESAARRLRARARLDARAIAAGACCAVGHRGRADACRSTCSRSRSWRRPRTRASCSASSRPRRTRRSTRPSCSRAKVQRRLRVVPGDGEHLPDHVARRAASAAWSRSRGASGRRPTEQLLMEASGKLSQIPGVRVIPMTPPPLPGGGDFPVDLVIASTAEPRAAAGDRRTAGAEGVRAAACSSSPTPT